MTTIYRFKKTKGALDRAPFCCYNKPAGQNKMQTKTEIKILEILIGLMLFLFVVFIGWGISEDIEYVNRSKQLAEQMDCKYVGQVRNQYPLIYVECDREIRVIKSK